MLANPSKTEIWPQYEKDTQQWLYLKGGKDAIQTIEHRKETECKMWRNVRDIEYQLYGNFRYFTRIVRNFGCKLKNDFSVQAASQYRPTTLLFLSLVLCFAVYVRI